MALRDHGATSSDMERHEKGGFVLPEYNMVGYNYRNDRYSRGLRYCPDEGAEENIGKTQTVSPSVLLFHYGR